MSEYVLDIPASQNELEPFEHPYHVKSEQQEQKITAENQNHIHSYMYVNLSVWFSGSYPRLIPDLRIVGGACMLSLGQRNE